MPPPDGSPARSPQEQAADPRVSTFVTANAGSGKTSTLVSRVARLLLHGAEPAKVLCLTYTKAAAAEMQRRLFEDLGAWSVMPDGALRAALTRLGEPDQPARKARALFARALETPGGLKIQTIHAFCERLLRRFPLEAGVAPGFQVAEGPLVDAVAADARARLARRVTVQPDDAVGRAYAHFAVELPHRMFDDLLDALQVERDKVAELLEAEDAVATVWRRCGFEDGQPRDPRQIRAEAVAASVLDLEGWRALADALGGGGADGKAGLRAREALACAERGEPGFDHAWCALFTDENKPRWASKPPKALQSVLPWVRAEQARLAAARAVACSAAVARDTVHALVLGRAYAAAYDDAKRARNVLDFADLVARAGALVAKREDAAWVLYKLDGGIEHVLVDEAQDTAPEQWDIVAALTGEFFSGLGVTERAAPRTVFAVGDEKQSIYSFQGARPERLLIEAQRYETRVRDAGGAWEGVTLTRSWRSTPQVLSFVDAVFHDPATRAGVPAPPGHDVVRHEPTRSGPGCVDLWAFDQDPPAPKANAWDEPVEVELTQSARRRLAKRIALEIKAAVAEGETVGEGEKRRPCGYDDFLILVRRRDALFDEIIRALKKHDVPVGGADRLPLKNHILYDDLMALARVGLFPTDDLSLAALLKSPFFDVEEEGPDGLYRLAHGRTGSLWRRLGELKDESPAYADAHGRLVRVLATAPDVQPYEFYARFIAERGPDGRTMTERVLTRLGQEAADALDAFLGEAMAAEERGVFGLEAFAAAMEKADIEVKREQEEGRGEVRVMTVHGAKGLEAPVVYLPDTTTRVRAQGPALIETEDGAFLYAPRQGDDCDASAAARAFRDQQVENEAQRLLYVALTRARDRLVICGRVPANRQGPDDTSWYLRCEAGFAHGTIAPHVRTLWTRDGECEVRRYGPDPVLALRLVGTAERAALPDWLRQPPAAEPAAAVYASPSDLAARRKGAAPSPLEARGGLGRYRRGDLIHNLLERLPDVAVERRAGAAATLLAKHGDLTAEQRDEIAAAALAVLADPQFAEVFGPGSRAEAAIAGGAPDLPPGLAVSGRVDRMLVTPQRVLVIDYKTNRPPPERVEDADPAYLEQMAVYVAVLRAIFPGRRVEAALLWTDGPRLAPIPEELIEATLAGIRAAR